MDYAIRRTQRLVSGNICSEGLKSPAIFGFNCSETFPIVFEGTNMSFRVQNKVS